MREERATSFSALALDHVGAQVGLALSVEFDTEDFPQLHRLRGCSFREKDSMFVRDVHIEHRTPSGEQSQRSSQHG